jgi:hypothetical protein
MACNIQSFYRDTWHGEEYILRHKLQYDPFTKWVIVGIEIPNSLLDALPDIIEEAPEYFKVITIDPIKDRPYADGTQPIISSCTVIEAVVCNDEGDPYKYDSLEWASNIVKSNRTYYMDGGWKSSVSEFTEILWKFLDRIDNILSCHTDHGDACY